MSDSVDLVARLIAAGTPAALVAEVAMVLAKAEADHQAIEGRRAKDRTRQADRRSVMSRDITLDNATSAETADTPPLLDKETLPPTPPIKEINHTPRVIGALARKAAGFGPPDNVELDRWNVFCSQRKKHLTKIAYDRIVETLTDAANVGWPPGEVVGRSIESGWETVFMPKEAYGGRRSGAGIGMAIAGQRDGGRSQDGFLNAIREAADRFGPDDAGGMPNPPEMG